MDITYFGHSCFKINTSTISVLTDPFDPQKTGISLDKISADVVTISHDHFDHNCLPAVDVAKKVIASPGEYEIEGVSFIGIPSYHDKNKGSERGKNIIFVFETGSLRLAHLGDLGHELSEKEINAIGDIDVLFVPTGGTYTLNSQEAADVVRSIEPKIVIPMHYQVEGLNTKSFSTLEKPQDFISAMGLKVEEINKLALKEAGILSEDQKIVLLKRK